MSDRANERDIITFLLTVMTALKSDIVASFIKLLLSNEAVYVRRDAVREELRAVLPCSVTQRCFWPLPHVLEILKVTVGVCLSLSGACLTSDRFSHFVLHRAAPVNGTPPGAHSSSSLQFTPSPSVGV